MGLRIDRHAIVATHLTAGQRIERQQLVDLVAEETDPQPDIVIRGIDFDDIPAHAERAAFEFVVVALVLNLDQLPQNLVAVDLLALLERQHQTVVRLRRAEAVDTGDAGDDQHVTALEERPGGREPQPIDLFVDDRLLLDVRVGGGHVGFRLVVVVVADEELDGILREEAPELLVQLRRERLVVHHHQRRPVDGGQRLRHGERLARASDAQQDLRLVAASQAVGNQADRLRLVATQLEVGLELKSVRDRHQPNRMSKPLITSRLSLRGEIAGARPHLGPLQFRFLDLDLDAAKLAVARRHDRHVPDGVAGGELIEDLGVELVDFLG